MTHWMGDVSFWKLVGRALVYKMIDADLDTLPSLSENGKALNSWD